MENSISAILGLWEADKINLCADVNYAHIQIGAGSTLIVYTEEAAMALAQAAMECSARIRFRKVTDDLRKQEAEQVKISDLPD